MVAADGTFVETIHVEVRANNDAAAMQTAQKATGYVGSLQKLDVVEAFTLKKDGQKIPVDASAIYDQPAPGSPQVAMFTDARQKTIVFPQFAAGDTAVYTLKLTSQPYFPGTFALQDFFPPAAEFDDVRETIVAPKELPLQTESDGVDFTRKQAGANVIYTWRFKNLHPSPNELVAISPVEHMPRFFVTSFKDYTELGHTFAEAAAQKMVVTPQLSDLAAKITQGTSDRREQAKKIYEWVSGHIRYVAEELGKGSLVPHDAGIVLNNGYGDCKDHVVLLGALLKAQGIESKAILLNGGNEYSLPKVATFATLSHAITWIPEFDIYLDSNAAIAPFGYLPLEEYGKPMVVASLDDAHAGTMPLLQPGQMDTFTKTVSSLDKDGVLTGTTVTQATGPSSILLRIIGLGIQKLGPEAAGTQQLSALGHKDATGRIDAPPPLELTPTYAVTGTFRSQGWTSELAGTQSFYLPGGMRLLGLSGDGLMGPFNAGNLKDSEPVLCFNGREAEELSLTAPAGVHFSETPKDVSVKTANISFTAHWTLAAGTMTVKREFIGSIDKAYCTADIRKANAAALKEISDGYLTELSLSPDKKAQEDNSPSQAGRNEADNSGVYPTDEEIATFNAANDAGNSRNYNKAIQMFSSLLPERKGLEDFYAALYLRRAFAYGNLGKEKAALADLNESLRLKPEDLQAVGVRATIYMRNSDSAHALPDLDRLIAAKPEDGLYDMRGTALIRLGQYNRAISDYDVLLKKSPNNTMYLQLRGMAYTKTGRFDQAVTDLRHAAGNDLSDISVRSMLCEALARSTKPADAIPTCALLLQQSPYLADVLNWRGYAYYRLGNFAKAEQDFAKAANVYPNEATYLFERGAAKIKAGDRAGGEKDVAAAKQMSPSVAQKMTALNIGP